MKFDTAGSDRDINPSTEISTFRIASPHVCTIGLFLSHDDVDVL